MQQPKAASVRRVCVCGNDTWLETKTRDAAGKMPVHGTLSCSSCGAEKFASRFVEENKGDEEE